MNSVRSSLAITTKRASNCREIFATSVRCVHETRKMFMADGKDEGKDEKDNELTLDELSAPTNCCMSGCANCVWIQYAEKLNSILEKSEVDVQKMIIEKIEDPNMRAFLSMELRCRNLLK